MSPCENTITHGINDGNGGEDHDHLRFLSRRVLDVHGQLNPQEKTLRSKSAPDAQRTPQTELLRCCVHDL